MDDRSDLTCWWNLDEQALYARLECDGRGLSAEAASRRQAKRPPRSRLAGLWDGARFLLRRFASPLVLILLIAGAVSASLGEMGNALIIAVLSGCRPVDQAPVFFRRAQALGRYPALASSSHGGAPP